jgi:hypothetical protein
MKTKKNSMDIDFIKVVRPKKNKCIRISVYILITGVLFQAFSGWLSAQTEVVRAAISLAKQGDTIIVPAGQAICFSELIITKNLFLIGSGAGSSVVTSGINKYAYLIVYKPASFLSDQPFRVSGFTLNLNNSSHGIFFDGTRNTTCVLQRNAGSTIIPSRA